MAKADPLSPFQDAEADFSMDQSYSFNTTMDKSGSEANDSADPTQRVSESFHTPLSTSHASNVTSSPRSVDLPSAMPTPNLAVDHKFSTRQHVPPPISNPNTTRKPSLRFKLPKEDQYDSAHSSLATTPNSSTVFNRESPFLDQRNVIPENHLYNIRKPQSPFAQESFSFGNDAESDDFYHVDESDSEDPHRDETVVKRLRWGTTRTKQGRPKKENVSRSKTLKGLLSPSASMMRSKSKKKPTRLESIRKPNTIEEDIIDNYSSDHNETASDTSNTPKEASDRKEEKRTIVFNRVLPDEFLDPDSGNPDTNYPRNKIRTTKYTPLSFLPKNISNQFIKNVANIYFLVLIILGAFDIFGVPSPILAAVPLIVIVCITAIKDAIEDSRRTSTDMEVNNQTTHILTQQSTSENGYVYENRNVNDEKVSLWRRFKKANSRLVMRFIGASKRNLTKEGRAKKHRDQHNLKNHIQEANARKSFESELSVRSSLDQPDPFSDQLRKSFQQQRRDNNTNRQRTLKFAKKYWKDVRVGDVLRIYNNDEIPADLIVLSTSDDDNCCFVETKNLDGETNLKVRQALKYGSVEQKIRKADDLVNHDFQVESEGPHANLYSYQGNLKYTDLNTKEEKEESITINNLLLRGCSLRNTKWVVGIVAFTGNDSKIMLNAGITPTKQSRISRELNYYVLLNFLLLFVICFASGLANGLWYRSDGNSREFFEFGTIAGSPFKNGLVGFFVALILYQSLVPVSLYITIEIIKTAQAFFVYSDIGMYYDKLDYPCTPKSWSISDDLGQIEYVFSDKTGTLTQNLMELKKCTINGVSYGRAYTEALAGLRKRQGYDVETEAAIERESIAKDREVMIDNLRRIFPGSSKYDEELSFVSTDFVDDLTNTTNQKQKESNEHFMLALALCHSVLIEEDPKDPTKSLLKAQSPDEAALVGTARSLGFSFVGNTKKGLLIDIQGTTKEYQVLNTLEFNSTRKRMSAIIKIPGETANDEPKALLICKGADSIIYGRLSKAYNDRKLLDTTSAHLEEYATEGLRTLCIAQRELTWSQYLEWDRRHKAASSSLDSREAKMEQVADSIERELILLGGTAIEDRLQDGVPDAISILADAGIKLWVLTGDKVETAINIGFSCNLLGNDMELLLLKTKLSPEEIRANNVTNYESLSESNLIDYLISHYLSKFFQMQGSIEELEAAGEDHSPPNSGFGVVIDGDALKLALLDPDTRRKFLLLCKQCKAVLCCRVSPAQKATVVKLVKDTLDVMTLAIGDGSNDVAMIQAADVGVGIAGEEGRQAVMSSDYAFGQFRFLVRLLLTHGRWSYKRFSEMIPSFFYKNCIFTIALFWYGVYNDFDGSYLFEFTYLMFYNLAFTSLPVIFLGIFDQDLSAKVSMLVPQVYRTGITRSEWTQSKFWWYMVDAIYQSVISFFFPYLLYRVSFPNTDALPVDHRFWYGILVTCIACISCNIYILSHQYRWDWLSTLIVVISILIIYIWTGLWTVTTYSGEFYKAAPQMFGFLSFWACTAIGVVCSLIPRFTYDFVMTLHWPKDVDIVRECASRGDFDMYPEDYDPTDPNRIKVSAYSSDHVRKMSMLAPAKTAGSTGSSSMDHDSPPHSPPARTVERKSVVDMFKRKSNIKSYYDNTSLIDTYNTNHASSSGDLARSIQTEEIAMEDFNQNQTRASRILTSSRRLSSRDTTVN